jgi:hypothetical protein
MVTIHQNALDTAAEYGHKDNDVAGANTARIANSRPPDGS